MKVRAPRVVIPLLGGVLLGGVLLGACTIAASGPVASCPVASGPVRAPRPGILGCVESRELRQYVLALDAHRRQARAAALAALGATPEERRGVFRAPVGLALGAQEEADGKRYAVAAEIAPHFEPVAQLAKQGPVLRRIDERPRAHAVDVLVCGIERCSRAGAGQRVEARPLVIELAHGERWGGSLELSYDYWWARVRYPRRETCPPHDEAPASID